MKKNRGRCFWQGFSNFIEKIFSPNFPKKGITERELRNALLEGEKSGVVESEERTMVEGVFHLGDRPVSAFMTHRSEILWLDIEAGQEEARRVLENSPGQLCFPVASGSLDNVKGAVTARDIFFLLLSGEWQGLKQAMHPPYFIPVTMSALKAFEAFKKTEAGDLFVIDEYGGFAGVLTVRNLIEEITGAFSASSGKEEGIAKQDNGTWLANGSVSIDEAARILELENFKEGQSEYHTLAGFILYLAGEIPSPGGHFDYMNYRFTVLGIEGNRIDKIMISKTKSEKGE